MQADKEDQSPVRVQFKLYFICPSLASEPSMQITETMVPIEVCEGGEADSYILCIEVKLLSGSPQSSAVLTYLFI